MKADIAAAASRLVGLPLWSSGIAGDMQWFSFGERREVTTRRGTKKVVGELALHVQCAWRMVRGDEIIADRHVTDLFENETREYVVQQVDVGDAGAMRIVLAEGLALEVFPTDSPGDEYWRLLRPSTEEPHFVVTRRGIEC